LQKPLPVSWIEGWRKTHSGFQYGWATDVIDGGVNGFWFIQKIIGNLLQNQYIAIE
jgi:hypothetical protein